MYPYKKYVVVAMITTSEYCSVQHLPFKIEVITMKKYNDNDINQHSAFSIVFSS